MVIRYAPSELDTSPARRGSQRRSLRRVVRKQHAQQRTQRIHLRPSLGRSVSSWRKLQFWQFCCVVATSVRHVSCRALAAFGCAGAEVRFDFRAPFLLLFAFGSSHLLADQDPLDIFQITSWSGPRTRCAQEAAATCPFSGQPLDHVELIGATVLVTIYGTFGSSR